MAFCSSCGAQVDGQFCSKCGAMVTAGPAAAASPTYSQPASTGMSDNVASGLCYVLGLITGIVFLVIAPYNQNKTVRFHAFQSIFLNLAMIVCWIALSIVFVFLHFLGAIFGLFLGPLIWLAFLVLWAYVIISAFQGKKVVLPVIGPLAEQQA